MLPAEPLHSGGIFHGLLGSVRYRVSLGASLLRCLSSHRFESRREQVAVSKFNEVVILANRRPLSQQGSTRGGRMSLADATQAPSITGEFEDDKRGEREPPGFRFVRFGDPGRMLAFLHV